MSQLSFPAPCLRGISIGLPAATQENAELAKTFGETAIQDLIRVTGIERRPFATHHTVSELGTAAVNDLLQRLNWSPASIDLLLVVTQTPDYPLPGTSSLIQHAAGLPVSTTCIDLSLGCAGYVQALSVASALLASGAIRRALLVSGDITSRMIDPADRSLAPLFGDAVAATALEAGGDSLIHIDLGTDGSGAPYLMSRTGGLVCPGRPQLAMDGMQVLSFSLNRLAPSVAAALKMADKAISDMDLVVLHQANALMLRTLGKKIGANDAQLVNALRDFGNTGSASIPVALCSRMEDVQHEQPMNLLLCGFGVGWSWGSAVWQTPPPLIHACVRLP